MTAADALILGVVEGVTEFLPISSTGHLIIVASLLGLDQPPETKRAVDAFNIVIQGGAILAVLGLYWPRVRQMFRGLSGGDQAGRRLLINLAIAFAPAAVFGLLLNDWIERHLFHPIPVLGALAAGGIAMILIGRWQRHFFYGGKSSEPHDAHECVDIEHLTWRRALIVGILQCLAMWPGTSRSMVTIVGGMIVGLKPRQAAEFSFLLGLPTLGGACVYSLAKNLASEEANLIQSLGWAQLIIGIVAATVSASLAIKWLVAFLNRHGLAIFGWYRLALCAVMAILVWRGVIELAPGSSPESGESPTTVNQSQAASAR